MRNRLLAGKVSVGFIVAIILLGGAIPGAPDQQIGLGVILGEPTGLSGKMWLGAGVAIAGGAAWSFRNEAGIHLHADYLLHHTITHPPAAGVEGGPVIPTLHYGLGGRIKAESDTRLSLRFPAGITGHLREAPMDMFVEIVPLLDLAPATEFDLNAAVGLRYYF